MRQNICIHCRSKISINGTEPDICLKCERIIRNAQAYERFIYLSE